MCLFHNFTLHLRRNASLSQRKSESFLGVFTTVLLNCFFLLKESSLSVSSYWRNFHHMFLLIEGTFSVLLLREFSSLVSSYWRSFLCPLWRNFITCFFLLKELSLSVRWSSSDQFNPVLLTHGIFLGSSSSFLTFCLDASFSTLFSSLTSLWLKVWSP